MKKYEKHKQGLWAIIAPVNGYIKTAIGLSIIGGITSIIGFVLLAYVLLLSIKEKSDFFQFELSFNEAFLLLAFVVIISF